LPENNLDLRRAHRPIEDFVRAMLRQPLLFAPGTAHIYSNCAITAAAEIVGRAAAGALGRRVDEPLIGRFHALVRERVLETLGMTSTGYHPPSAWDDRIALVADTGQEGETWEMSNSDYYRGLGIPWGGMYGTPREIARFADLFLPGADGVSRLDAPAGEARRLLSPAAARAMRSPQWIVPDAPPHVAPELREGVPNPPRPEVTWGIGWQVQGSGRALELASPSTYFHGGASGTFVWADPATEVTVAVFTNRASRGWPTDRPHLALFANAVTAALR
jgi:CubicO group peptidase (beta-lactamase class C family)